MTILEDMIELRDNYLTKHGLTAEDFGLNYCYPVIPYGNWEWYKQHNFSSNRIYKRAGLFLIYLDPKGEPYLKDEVPYGVVRFLGEPVSVPEEEKDDVPKAISQWGRRSELHFEPLRDGTPWESIPHGSIVVHCESLVKAKAVHKATGLPCIGYNGVNGYSSSKQGIELIHMFADFAFDKMHNVILFDSDVVTNPRVANARETLSHKLRHIANCSMVSWATLPQRVTESAPPTNWGPDDFLLEHGPEALMRVINEAIPYRDEEFSSLVEAMNERARWVRNQNAVFDRQRRALVKWGDAVLAFRNINRVVVSGKTKKVVYAADEWLKSIHRQEVDGVGYRYLAGEFFERGHELLANEFMPGGTEPAPESLRDDDIVYQMLRRLFKKDDLELLRSYLKFLRFTPDKPTSYCILWSNERGVGKGWFTELARSLLGRQHVSATTADALAEKFNLHTINCRLLIAHEFHASSGANKKLALQYLKNYVGDETIMVRAMNRNPYQAEVRSGLIITVNDKGDMPSDGLGDRRQWYIEGGAGARELGLEVWEPEAPEWDLVWSALKDPDMMGRFARWVQDAQDIDFKSWRPPMTEERVADLIEGQNTLVQIAHDVLLTARELGIRVLDPKSIRQMMVDRMDGQDLYLIGKAFGKCLRDAGWWTDKQYERSTDSKSSAWFTFVPAARGYGQEFGVSNVPAMIREDTKKIQRKF